MAVSRQAKARHHHGAMTGEPGAVTRIWLGYRARLDAGTLGVVAVTVNSAVRAVGLLGGGRVTVLAADEVMVDADEPGIPVGTDGGTVLMPHPGATGHPAAGAAGPGAKGPARGRAGRSRSCGRDHLAGALSVRRGCAGGLLRHEAGALDAVGGVGPSTLMTPAESVQDSASECY